MAEEKSKKSTKRLVKILVILGIGIPVLVELMTLFNLIDAQMFEGDETEVQGSEQSVEVRAMSEGDSLFTDYSSTITLKRLRVRVSAQEWRFELGLQAVDNISQDELQISIDSLKLQSDKILLEENSSEREIKNERPVTINTQWELPNGDIPKEMYISSVQKVSSDSVAPIQEQVFLDKIPVRYSQE